LESTTDHYEHISKTGNIYKQQGKRDSEHKGTKHNYINIYTTGYITAYTLHFPLILSDQTNT